MLLCIHFSEQLKLVSLDIDQKNFEFDAKGLVLPESYVPIYIDASKSKKYKSNPFLISLFFMDPSSHQWYCYFFILKNDKFVNLGTPWSTPYYKKITIDSGTYYKVSRHDGILIGNKNFNSIISKDNLITEDGSAIEEIDMKSIQMTLKSELKSGSIISYTAEYEGSFPKENSGSGWFFCLKGKKSTKGQLYRYKLTSDNQAVNEESKRKRWYSLGHFCNKKNVEKSSNEENCVKEEPEQDRIANKESEKDYVAEESTENVDVNKESVKDHVAEESTENVDVSKEHAEDHVAEESTENVDVSEEHAEDHVAEESTENVDVNKESVKDRVVAEESTENVDVSKEHSEDPVAEESTENIDIKYCSVKAV
ncbi:hypothetical protein BdWA1_002871 [Babesia duncani]|uniref:Uncharacterized protein n=1 Tax=Babesia duncani TaxID=323732 RepID=A0AAD9PI56_9APIC|nr:hypothetical protein BdWA1_002871 [Babesia duncani]